MSNNGGFIPNGVTHYALQIVERFRLNKAGSLLPIERILQAALDDARRADREREPVGCARCGTLLPRYQAIREEFRDCCPECREPMETPAMLDRRRVRELEERLRAFSPAASPAARWP